MPAKNLLIYSDAHVLGGADRYLLNLIPILKNDWQITYVYRKDVDFGNLIDQFKKMGVICLKVAEPNFNFQSFRILRKLFATQKPDLIVFNQGSFYTSKAARLVAVLQKIPHLIIQHGSTFEGKKFYSVANKAFARLTFPAALSIIVPSKSSEEFFNEHFGYLKNIKVINHGIDLLQFSSKKYSRLEIRKTLKIPETAPTLIFIGRLEDDKNADHLINLYRKINLLDSHFIIIGDGSLDKDLKKQVRANNYKNILFLGKTDGTAEYLAASDVLVLPSRSESFSLAVVEAMTMGVVPVAFKIDSLPRIIGDESLIAEYPDFDAMAKITRDILQNNRKRKELAAKVRLRAQKLFDLKRMQLETQKIFEEIYKTLNNKLETK